MVRPCKPTHPSLYTTFTLMDEKTPEPKRPERPLFERRTPPLGGNVFWYLILLGIGTLFFVNYMTADNQVEIPYMDLWKLIEQGAPQINPRAAIEISPSENAKGKEIVFRYSNLDNLRIGPQEITGTITKETVKPQPQRPLRKTTSSFTPPGWDWKTTTTPCFNCSSKKALPTSAPKRRPAAGTTWCP